MARSHAALRHGGDRVEGADDAQARATRGRDAVRGLERVLDGADATAEDRTGHPHETAPRCGELRTERAEARVEHGREIVERVLRRPVGAEQEVLRGRDILGQGAVIGLPSHHVGVGIRGG